MYCVSISFIPFIKLFDFMRLGSTASAEALAKAGFSFLFDFMRLGSTNPILQQPGMFCKRILARTGTSQFVNVN
jgi:hypothetical protein